MTSILVIEDNQDVLGNVVDILELTGYEVTGAANGRYGIQAARQYLPDLVICDITMPEVDGYGVLKELGKDPQTAVIPFIFLSAKNERECVRKGMELGADDYITKPFSSNELLSAVKTQLKKQATLSQQHETTLHLLRTNIMYALQHELRSPLGLIIGYADFLRREHSAATPDEIRDWSHRIWKASQRLHRATENYLVYAQLELMASDPEQLAGLRNHVVGDAGAIIAEQARQTAAEGGRQEDLKLDLCKIGLRISEEDLKKIVEELVGNAFKFSEPGTEVRVESFREDRIFTLNVCDRGRGMTAEQIRTIGPYMQFQRTLYEQQGLGMGFVIVKRLVELHGGRMLVSSEPNSGTCVSIQFPV